MMCRNKKNNIPSLGEAPMLEIRYYPKMSRDANGSTEIIEIRCFFNVAGHIPMPHSAKTQRLKVTSMQCF